MAATAGGTPARTPAKRSSKPRAAANGAGKGLELPHPVPPRDETFRHGPQGNGEGTDTEADRIMLPGGFSFEPIRFEEEDAPEEIRVPLFYGPDGTEYTVWANPPPRIGLTQLSEYGQRGGDEGADIVATSRMMTAMLGADGFAALLQMKSLDLRRYAQITAIVQRIAMGPLEVPKDAGSA